MMHPCVVHRPRLAVGEVHVWFARLVDDLHVTADLLQLLDQGERARAAQFLFERDRVHFIQAHGIVRRILADYSEADAATLTFARSRHGKPFLIPRANMPSLQFSVSHSGDCCMVAVRLDHAIGVDLERVRELPQAVDIARRYFAPAENAVLAALQGTALREAFFALWTHKEAMVKGLGVGLAANLGRVEFDLDPARGPRLVAWDGDRSVAQSWFVRRLDPAPGYVAAVASASPIRSLKLRDWSNVDAD
jgi:4'-phosphopantetheinyl transferase